MTGTQPRLKLTVYPKDPSLAIPPLPLSSAAQIERVRGSLLALQKTSVARRTELEENSKAVQAWMTQKEACHVDKAGNSTKNLKASKEDEGSETSA